MNTTHDRSRGEAGFTLIELLVVMGILTGFLTMLVQLVDGGVTMFRDGEVAQVLADRGSRAQDVLTSHLRQLRGSAAGRDRQRVDDRLVVQVLPIGLPPNPERGATRVQVLRAAVHLAPEQELQIVDRKLIAEVLAEDPALAPELVEAEVEKRRVDEPLRGVGNLLMLPWRSETDEALLELRVGWFLPGQLFPVGPDRFVDPFDVPLPGGDDLPGLLVYQVTEPVLTDLLHVEFAFWSQRTTSWGDDAGPLHGFGAPRANDPFGTWDSARGGWLVDDFTGGAFPFDVGPWSENDPRDDVHPHAILVRCVVAQPDDATPEGLTASFLGADDGSIYLYDGTAFPGPRDGGFVKVGDEWVRYGALDGDRLTGVRRGQRATRAHEHEAGTRVQVGRTLEFVVPVLHAKDDWNG